MKIIHYLLVAALSLSLAACNKSSSGGVEYTGLTTQATVNSSNAVGLVSLTLGGFNQGAALSVYSLGNTQAHAVAMGGVLNDAAAHVLAQYSHVSIRALQKFNQTLPGAVSGSVQMSGQLDDVTFDGTITATFNQMSDDGITTLNGTMTMVVSGSGNNVAITFSGFSVVDASGTTLMDGSLAVTSTATTQTLTMNFVSSDAKGSQMKIENFAYNATVDAFGLTLTETYSGRIYDSSLGYVDISTQTPLVYLTAGDFYPSSGGSVVISGAGGTKVKVTPVDNVNALVEADTTGNGVFDFSQTTPWANL